MTPYITTAIMPIYGLIHDGQLRACPYALLKLMYGLKWLYVIRYLGFQFVGNCIKGQALPFSLVFLEFLCQEIFFHNQIGFLNVHGGHCTTTVYIHYIFFLCNSTFFLHSIHENFISASSYTLHIFLVD